MERTAAGEATRGGSFLIWTAAAVSAAVLFSGWIALGVGGPVVTRVFDDLALLAAATAGAVSCFLRSRRPGEGDRGGWRLLALSCLFWAAGQAVWAFYQNVLGRPTPFPSVGDVAYLVSMPLAGWAVLRFAWIPTRVSRLRSLLDGLLIAGSFACLSWYTVLERAWRDDYGGWVGKAFALAYPLGQAATACLVVVVLRRCRRERLSVLLVGAGLVTLAGTNVVYANMLADGRYHTGSSIDVGWLIGFALIGLAGRSISGPPAHTGAEDAGQPLWLLLLPYAPVTLVAGLTGVIVARGGEVRSLMLAGTLGLTALVLARHCLTIVEQKSVEAELRRTSRRLNEAQELAQMGSWEWDLASDRVDFSDELYRIHGMEPGCSDLTSQTYLSFVLPEDRPRFDAVSAMVAATGEPSDTEYRIVRPDGAVRWLRGRSSPAVNRRGDQLRRYGTLEDITDRKVAEDALHLQARLLQSVAQAVVATDPGGQVIYWNSGAESIYGWSAAEMVGRHITDIVPADMMEEAGAIMQDLARGDTWSGDFWMMRRDGSRFPVFVTDTPVFDDAGNLVALIGASIDMTERRAADDLLRASEERFRRLVEASPLAILELDSDGRVKLCNEAARGALGRARAGLAGETGFQHDAVLDDVRARVMAGERITEHEVATPGPDGSPVHLTVAAEALRNAAGEITGAIVVGADVTHRRSLETQLLQAQKLEAVGRLAGGIAHDFNNLLTVVLGHSDLLLAEMGDQPRVRAGLETIRSAAERGAALTSRLLTFSRKRISTRAVVDLNEAVLSMRDLLTRTLGEDVAVETILDPGAGYVSMGRSELDQVVLNLAVNARDAMPQGGSLVLETCSLAGSAAAGEAEDGLPAGDYTVLTVTDTGTGMDPGTLANCFEPFFTTKPQGKGTGLGLATVYGIVSGAGGRIRVASSPREGTRFRILLPAVPCPAPAEEPASCRLRGPGAPASTVLLVEDEPDVRLLALRVLEREGYRVLTAPNGIEALAVAGPNLSEVDVLVTDVVMPELGGIDLAKELVRQRPELGVVFISGYTDKVLPELRAGEKPWLVEKPFQPDALARTVREMLRERPRRRDDLVDGVVRLS